MLEKAIEEAKVKTRNDSEVIEYINGILDKLDGKFNVYVKDLRRNKVVYNRNASDYIDCSNLISFPVLFGVLNGILDKNVKLKDVVPFDIEPNMVVSYIVERREYEYTYEELLGAMIITNDINARNLIMKHYGEKNINNFLDKFGLNKINGTRFDESIENLGRVFETIYKKRDLTPRLCDFGIKYMERAKDSTNLTRQIIDNVVVSQISGDKSDSASAMGVVNVGHEEYMIIVVARNMKNTIIARRIIGLVSRGFYEEFSKEDLV
ncbi:MAG: serine hydrolase [Lachnospirales bacterium]